MERNDVGNYGPLLLLSSPSPSSCNYQMHTCVHRSKGVVWWMSGSLLASGSRFYTNLSYPLQAYLGDITVSIPDHCNKAGIVIK